MQEWLTSANYAPGLSGSEVELVGIEPRHLMRAFAGDLNRTASAGSESLYNIIRNDSLPKSLGWSYVKLYYSSLFYAHTILRIWGRSPSYLRTSDLMRIRHSFDTYGIQAPFKLNTGQYIFTADFSFPRLKIRADKSGGGTHEAIWREFGDALSNLRSKIALAPYTSADKTALDAALLSATALLTNNGANSAWLSVMRNDIQYRQAGGLWYPYTGRKKATSLCASVKHLLADETSVELSIDRSGDDLTRFHSACTFVIVFARQILADLANASGARSFLKFGQAEFERAVPLYN